MDRKILIVRTGIAGLIIFFTLQLCAQGTSLKQSFTIHGLCKGMADDDIIYLTYRENGKLSIDSTKVRNHSFQFSGKIGGSPIKASLSRNQNPTHDFKSLNDSKSIYLEPGKIKLRSNDTLSTSVLSGTDLNRTLQLKDERLYNIIRELNSIEDPYFFNEEKLKDTVLVKNNQRMIDSLYLILRDQELDFASEHPNSYLSLDIVARTSKITGLIAKTEKVFNGLSDALKAMPEANVVRNNIKGKKKVQIGSLAPLFEMNDIDGNTVKLDSYMGRFVLLDFWASWCLPCRNEHPNLAEIHKLYGSQNFSILSISIDSKEEDWKRAVKEDNITWTQLSDLKASKGEVYGQYGITVIPSNFLIDPNGKVIAKDLKGKDLKVAIQNLLK